MRLNSMSSTTSSSVTLPLPLYSVPGRSSRLWSTRGRIGRIRYCSRLTTVGLIYNLALFVPLYLDYLYPATLTQSTFTILIYATQACTQSSPFSPFFRQNVALTIRGVLAGHCFLD